MKPAGIANLANLTGLWRCMGARSIESLKETSAAACSSWPHRAWIDPPHNRDTHFSEEFCSHVAGLPGAVVPVWGGDSTPLRRHGFAHAWSLTAMSARPITGLAPSQPRAKLVAVSSDSEARTWTKHASAAFGYHVDIDVVRRLRAAGVGIYLTQTGGEYVGTVLLYEQDSTHSGVIGVHMVGVVPNARRQGFARDAMLQVMQHAQATGAQLLVLQAAANAQPLYASLGFEALFSIDHYTRKVAEPAEKRARTTNQ